MKIISPFLHGCIDYLAVLLIVAIPDRLGLAGLSADLVYGAAGVFLLLGLFTNMPLGALQLVPFRVHGAVEALSVLALAGAPWLFGFADQPLARNLFLVLALAMMAVVLFTDWQRNPRSTRPSLV